MIDHMTMMMLIEMLFDDSMMSFSKICVVGDVDNTTSPAAPAEVERGENFEFLSAPPADEEPLSFLK